MLCILPESPLELEWLPLCGFLLTVLFPKIDCIITVKVTSLYGVASRCYLSCWRSKYDIMVNLVHSTAQQGNYVDALSKAETGGASRTFVFPPLVSRATGSQTSSADELAPEGKTQSIQCFRQLANSDVQNLINLDILSGSPCLLWSYRTYT